MSQRYSRRYFLSRAAALAGALWVTSIRAAAAAGPPRPLLLVHGFGDQVATWHRSDNAIVARLSQAGYGWDSSRLLAFVYPSQTGRPDLEDSQGDIARAGLALARAIRVAASQSADGQVDLLAFSMGGLVSRWAIDWLRNGTRGGPLVNAAVLIATPNGGVDVLQWLSGLGQQARLALEGLARDLANLDLTSVAARQMQPGSDFLQQLNDGSRLDDRVAYAVVAGDARLELQIGSLAGAVALGDGFISPASAGYLPGLAPRLYLLEDRLGGAAQAPWEALQQAAVFHPMLPQNDDAALAAVGALAPWATAVQEELSARLQTGDIRIAG